MQLFEMQGLLAGKCLPGDMLVGESLAKYLLRQLNQRDELARQVSALQTSQDNIINGLGIKGDGLNSKLVIEYVLGLVAENVALKSFGNKLDEMHNDLNGTGTGIQGGAEVACQQVALEAAMEEFDAIKTPSTDAAIAEIESSGAEKMFNLVEPVMRNFCNPAIVELAIEELESLAANLRAGRKG